MPRDMQRNLVIMPGDMRNKFLITAVLLSETHFVSSHCYQRNARSLPWCVSVRAFRDNAKNEMPWKRPDDRQPSWYHHETSWETTMLKLPRVFKVNSIFIVRASLYITAKSGFYTSHFSSCILPNILHAVTCSWDISDTAPQRACESLCVFYHVFSCSRSLPFCSFLRCHVLIFEGWLSGIPCYEGHFMVRFRHGISVSFRLLSCSLMSYFERRHSLLVYVLIRFSAFLFSRILSHTLWYFLSSLFSSRISCDVLWCSLSII